MDFTTQDVGKFLTAPELNIEFRHNLNNVCQLKNPHLETWMEIFFLKTVREKEADKVLNIANNLSTLKDGDDVRQVFYGVILSNFIKGAEDDFIYQALSRPEARVQVIRFICKLPVADIPKILNKLTEKYFVPAADFYLDILSDQSFYPIDKFTTVFESCDFPLRLKIIERAIIVNNYSICSKINTYCQNNPVSFYNLSYDITYDHHNIIRAIAYNLSLSNLMYGMSEFKKLILEKYYYFPQTIDQLLYRSITEKNSTLLIELASVIPKRKIIGILFDLDSQDLIAQFLSRFRDDPELEHFVPFS
jgi:hypothetical protein